MEDAIVAQTAHVRALKAVKAAKPLVFTAVRKLVQLKNQRDNVPNGLLIIDGRAIECSKSHTIRNKTYSCQTSSENQLILSSDEKLSLQRQLINDTLEYAEDYKQPDDYFQKYTEQKQNMLHDIQWYIDNEAYDEIKNIVVELQLLASICRKQKKLSEIENADNRIYLEANKFARLDDNAVLMWVPFQKEI